MVVEVSEIDPRTDEAALKELSKAQANVCVLAPFSRHVIRNADHGRWRDRVWAPNADWRERLVKWANARVPEPQDLDVEDVMLFLEAIDPHEHLFVCPRDVLAVAARAYRAGLPKGSSALRDLAQQSLGRLFSSNDSLWARSFGLAAVEALVERRLVSTDRPAGALTLDEWAALLPADLTPAEQPTASGKAEQRHLVEGIPAIQAVRILADAEALGTTEDGRRDFSPWVRAAIERSTIGATLKGIDLEWALWSVEPTRRDMVDDALDAASPAALLRLVRRARSTDDSDLRTVAAVEALFSALGRRLAGEWKPSAEMVADLQQLGLRQLELVRNLPHGSGFPGSAPLTRQSRQDCGDAVPKWIGEAWTFSLAVPPPKGRVDAGWILPGWSTSLRIADAPETLPHANHDQRLLAASRATVRACRDKSLPERVPHCLLAWVIIDGPARGWALPRSVQYSLFHVAGIAQLVGRLLWVEPTDVRERGAGSVWDAALVESGGDPLHALRHIAHASLDLYRIVLDHLPAEAFESALSAKLSIVEDDGQLLRGLPARLVRPALAALVDRMERDGRPVSDIEQVLDALDENDLDLLLRFGAQGFSQGYAAARRVWSISPESAIEQARIAMRAREPTAQVWFATAPSEHFTPLLASLGKVGPPAPSWCAAWLVGVLPRAGRAAPAVFDLLRRVQPDA